jgi:hypothetical protein
MLAALLLSTFPHLASHLAASFMNHGLEQAEAKLADARALQGANPKYFLRLSRKGLLPPPKPPTNSSQAHQD